MCRGHGLSLNRQADPLSIQIGGVVLFWGPYVRDPTVLGPY